MSRRTKPSRWNRDDLRECMEKNGWTQAGLAKLLDMDERTVRRWASGETDIPHIVTLALRWLEHTEHID